MQYNFFDINSYKANPKATFFAICIMLLFIGALFLERNACKVAEYIYTSNRLSGEVPIICKIF